jgi:hypothetical protein
MNADQMLEYYTAKIDAAICEGAVRTAQHLLNAGTSIDDLPRLMEPIIQRLAEWRAETMAAIQAHVVPMQAIEARLRVNEALIERIESGATVH